MLPQYADWVNFLALTRSDYLSKLGVLPRILSEANAEDAETIMVLWALNAELDAINAAKDGANTSSPGEIKAFTRQFQK